MGIRKRNHRPLWMLLLVLLTGGLPPAFAEGVNLPPQRPWIDPLLLLSQDIYLKNSGYQFSQFRHRTRGYPNRYELKYINGVRFNEQVRGVFNYSSIGALNDLTREGNRVHYLASSPFAFGNIGGSEDIDMRPAGYTRGGKLTLSGAWRNYYLRGMGSYSTGLLDNGWAFTGAIGGRYAHEGAIPGTFYKNISYSVGAEYQWNDGEHSVSLVTFGSPVARGQQGSSVEEAVTLVGNNLYNPNWGFQNGKKRNARVVKSWDPTLICSYVWKPNLNTIWTTGISFHYNRYGRTALNWYNGADPRPDYYRYLPSYFSDSPLAKEYYTYLWRDKKISQIDWDRLYQVNAQRKSMGDGSAVYMVEERRSDLLETAFNSTFATQLTPTIRLTAGINNQYTLAPQFKTVDDLLGADYVLDVDKFAERDFPGDWATIQSDLNNPDRKVKKGDVFSYSYNYRIHNTGLWVQQEHKHSHIDLYYGAMLEYSWMAREGKMRNGRFPNSSFGLGKGHSLMLFSAKLGVLYKITGRNLLALNASYNQQPPLPNDMYVAPENSDATIEDIRAVQIANLDLSYIFSYPFLAGRISAFYTQFLDDTKKISYYHDTERAFVHHALYGVNRVHRGIELGLECKPVDGLTLELIGTAAQYYYSNNPMGVMTSSNGKINAEKEVVYMKNLYLGGVPQLVGTFGVGYFYRYWFFNLYINGFGYNHIDPAPIRRLASNYQSVAPPESDSHNEKRYNAFKEITFQERFKGGYTLDLSIGKIIYLPKRQSININLAVNNLLNNQSIRTGGYEQGRINLDYPERFRNKHYYMQGVNFFLNASYRF